VHVDDYGFVVQVWCNILFPVTTAEFHEFFDDVRANAANSVTNNVNGNTSIQGTNAMHQSYMPNGFTNGNIDTIDFDSFDIPERVVQGTFSC
jgi:hypothetical protein